MSRGANVNAQDNQKYTPLHCAAYVGSLKLSELLVANGADVTLQNVDNGTAFQLAATKEFEELAKYLQELEVAAGGPAATAQQSPTQQKPAIPPGTKPGKKKPKEGQ